MGILARVRLIFTGNVNNLLDKVEDPALTLEALMDEMRARMVKIRLQVIEAATEEKVLAKKIEEADANSKMWDSRAKQAIAKGDDALAKQALHAKAKAAKGVEMTRREHQVVLDNMALLKEELAQLELRFKESEEKKDVLIARIKVAAARNAANSAVTNPVIDVDDQANLTRAEDKIRRLEARAEVSREMLNEARAGNLDAKFRELDAAAADEAIEQQLAQMKAQP